jgi:putative peptidoglycan lipid II flippase
MSGGASGTGGGEGAPEDSPQARRQPAEEGAGQRASQGVSRAVGLISAMVLVSRLLGFARDAIIAARYGSSSITDAYLYAFTLPDTLWNLVAGGAFFAAFVPVITEYFTNGDEEAAWKTYSIITTFLFCVLTVVIGLAWVFARELIGGFLARGFPDHDLVDGVVVHPLSMAVDMSRIVLPAQYCFFLGTLMMGMLQARRLFFWPAVGPVIYNLGIIVGGLLFSRWLGIAAFSWGALGGAVIGNLLLQIWALRGINPRFRPSLELSFPGVKRAGQLVLPVIFGVSLPQATQLVNGMFVAKATGAKSILEYTNKLMQLPLGIFGQAIGIAVLPTLSAQAAKGDMPAFRETLNHGVRLALFLTVPTSILMIVLAQPLIALVYQRGEFTARDTLNAVPALVLFSVGVSAWSAQSVVARAFYARKDTWTPVLAGTFVTFCVFIPLSFILTPLFHVPGTPLLTQGPALATSIAATTNALLLLYFAAKRFGGVNARRILASFARILLASGPMAAVAYGCYHGVNRLLERSGAIAWAAGVIVDIATKSDPGARERLAAYQQTVARFGDAGALVVAGLVGLAAYGVVCLVLRSEEVRDVVGLIRRRRRRVG